MCCDGLGSGGGVQGAAGVINDATVADAILERLVHNAYRLKLEGESMRDPKTKPKTNRNPSD